MSDLRLRAWRNAHRPTRAEIANHEAHAYAAPLGVIA